MMFMQEVFVWDLGKIHTRFTYTKKPLKWYPWSRFHMKYTRGIYFLPWLSVAVINAMPGIRAIWLLDTKPLAWLFLFLGKNVSKR